MLDLMSRTKVVFPKQTGDSLSVESVGGSSDSTPPFIHVLIDTLRRLLRSRLAFVIVNVLLLSLLYSISNSFVKCLF